MGELAFAVLRRQLAVVRAKEPGTRLGEDPEEPPRHAGRDRVACGPRWRCSPTSSPCGPRCYARSWARWAAVLGAVRRSRRAAGRLGRHGRRTAGSSAPAPAPKTTIRWPSCPRSSPARDHDAARADMLGALDSVRWERLARGLSALAQQGPARRSVAPRRAGRHRHAGPDGGRATTKRPRPAGGRSGRGWSRTSTACASRASGCATRSSSAPRCTGVARHARPPARGAAGRARAHAGRRGGVQPPGRLATGEAHLPAATVFVMGGVAERHRRDVDRLLRRLPKELHRIGGRDWRDLAELMEQRRAEEEAARPPVRTPLRAVPEPVGVPEPAPTEETPGDVPGHPATSRAHRPSAAAPVTPAGMRPRRRP